MRIESLNKPIVDDDGHITELGELIADDKALDLEAWLDAKTWRLGYPKRLVEIADKRASNIPLTNGDMIYLCKWRKKAQKRLF